MGNKHLTYPPSEMFTNRLGVLLDSVNNIYKTKDMVLDSDVASLYEEALGIFIKTLDGSITGSVNNILAGSPADPFDYNVFTSAIMKDLQALFLEIGVLDRLVVSGFNSIIAAREQVLQASRRISNKLGDYLLYADPALGGGYFFGDSFSSADRIEVGSALNDEEECFLSQDEGVVLLPLDGSPEYPKIKSFVINKRSNGISGNNSEIGVYGHNEIEALGDNEPNTWYEYEKVTTNESYTPLILDLTIVLDAPSIINHININPINFGTPTPIKIVSIETSRDGIEYRSIKDEVPLRDYISEEEDDVFSLSPATSKYAGQGFYSFLPRRVQYVHLVFEQHTPYSINTLNGTRLRYAIGLRDINVMSRRFKTKGSIVSTPFTANNEVKKLAIWASENPLEASELADITHSVSYDDGAVWYPIQPQRRSGFDIPEVLNFNNIAEGAIETGSEVTTLRHKVSMRRFTEAFNGNVTLKQEKISKVDVVSLPTGGDFTMTLNQEPIADTVRVVLPFWGSYSCPRASFGSGVVGQSAPMDLDFVEFNVDAPPSGTLRYRLPYRGFGNLREHLRVFVNGEQWEYCGQDDNALGLGGNNSYTSYDTVDENSKVYFLNKNGGELQLGMTDSSGSQRGLLPGVGSRITVCLDGDNPSLELTDQGFVLTLTAPSDGIKENVDIISFESLDENEAIDFQMELPAGQSKFAAKAQAYTPALSSAFRKKKKSKSSSVISSTGVSTTNTKLRTSGTKFTAATKFIPTVRAGVTTKEEKEFEKSFYSVVPDGEEGAIPPVFLEGIDNFEIEERDLSTGELLTGGDVHFDTKVAFVNGDTEIRDPASNWEKIEGAYTFDPYTGAVYLGSNPLPGRRTIFKCKILRANVIFADNWEYQRSNVTGKIDTQKILLDPSVVYSYKREVSVTVSSSDNIRSVNLVTGNEDSHSWFNQKIIKGTLRPDSALFAEGVQPVEVPFIDGQSELENIVQVLDEKIPADNSGGPIYSFTLASTSTDKLIVGSPGFAPVRQIDSPSTPVSQFVTLKEPTATLTTNGDWQFIEDPTTKVVTVNVYQSGGLNEHYASYRYQIVDPGVDISGLYSVDYHNGTIYFASDLQTGTANISFEVSTYSAFYNIAQVVADGDIDSISETDRTITLASSFGLTLLKQDTISKARPGFAKVMYEYYKKTVESLKDLEPYFSPICKDVAFKAVTVDVLEEL